VAGKKDVREDKQWITNGLVCHTQETGHYATDDRKLSKDLEQKSNVTIQLVKKNHLSYNMEDVGAIFVAKRPVSKLIRDKNLNYDSCSNNR